MLDHLLDQPGALGGGGSPFVAKLETATPEHTTPNFQDCCPKVLEDFGAPHYGMAGRGLFLILLWLQEREEGTGKGRGRYSAMDHPATEHGGKVREENVRAVKETIGSKSFRSIRLS